MAKAVLISIRPEWVEKISSGEKTLELRKTKPKLETPFKCYIYCTKDEKDSDRLWVLREQIRKEYNGLSAVCANLRAQPDLHSVGNGHVVGEFVCDTYVTDMTFGHDALFNVAACMIEPDVVAYSAGNPLYGWHISDLRIYDKPHELGEFERPYECNECDAKWASECNACDKENKIKRPPQSWCYVEEGNEHE